MPGVRIFPPPSIQTAGARDGISGWDVSSETLKENSYMERRTFIQYLAGAALWAGCLPLQSLARRPLRFGIVTDLHYADNEPKGSRYYRLSRQKLHDAVDAFNRSGLDFIIELGDLKDTNPNRDPETTLGFLDDIEAELQRFGGPVYHALGNHDMDCITREEFLQHTRNPGKARGRSYYTFKSRGIQFFVLDANFNEDRTPYSRGNFSWKKAYIPDEEIEWLRRELQRSRKPAIVCCHQLLDSFSDVRPEVCVSNAAEVVSLLEESGRVLAVLQGHHHRGSYSQRAGIHYWTMRAMIENDYPAHNSYAIVTVEADGNITIEGFADCESRSLTTS